ncbi:hypothetical protein FACS1894181_08720 [Bacteroidia bacterium]|nr:hypothetical protein FACS1894181_08720 [Bacteroidia bacterium]
MNVRKIKCALLFVLALLAGTPAFAQEDFYPFSHLAVGVKTSTFGYGLELAAPLNNNFVLRAGINLTAGAKTPYMNVIFSDNDNTFSDAFGYVPEYRAKADIGFTHGNLLLDIHPGGIFHITAGVFAGQSKIKVNGFLADWRNGNETAVLKPGYTWPVLELGDQQMELVDGRANLELQMGNSIKPYIGLGVGRAVAKNSNVSFKFELGAIYLGNYTLKQNGTVLDLAASKDPDVQDVHDVLSLLKWWPMMNFQLSFRLF